MSEAVNVPAEFGLASGASVMCREVATVCPGDSWSQSELEAESAQPGHRPMSER